MTLNNAQSFKHIDIKTNPNWNYRQESTTFKLFISDDLWK